MDALTQNNPKSVESYNQVASRAKASDSPQTPLSLSDRYRFISEIGHGAQGKIFLARRIAGGIDVAIKQLNISSVKSWKAYDLFHREAETLASLNIDGVAKFYDAIECLDDDPPCSYIVQEYIQGKSLNDLLKAGHRFTLNRVYDLIIQTLKILSQLHAHQPPVIHRDIKPSNILIKYAEGDDFETYLIDFGAVANPQVQGGGSTVAGTFGYMAPEQMMGKPSPASDIYSLAAVAVYMISGKSPADMPVKDFRLIFEPDVQNMPPALVNTLAKMLDPKVENRLTDISKLIHIFTQYKNNMYELDSSGEFSLRLFNARIHQFETYGQNGAIELWQMLPDQKPRKYTMIFDDFFPCYTAFEPLIFDESKESVISMKAAKDKWQEWGGSPLLVVIKTFIFALPAAGPCLLVALIVLGVMHVETNLNMIPVFDFFLSHKLLSSYLLGLLVVSCWFLIIYLKHRYNMARDRHKVKSNRNIPEFNKLLTLHSTERYGYKCNLQNFNNLFMDGTKTIATITRIEYMPSVPDNVESNLKTARNVFLDTRTHVSAYAVHAVPSFLISYKFNPPDDASPNDLVHSIIIHQDPDKMLRVGDPIPILYRIYRNPASEYVVSIPFPFPFKDPTDYADIMGVSKTTYAKAAGVRLKGQASRAVS